MKKIDKLGASLTNYGLEPLWIGDNDGNRIIYYFGFGVGLTKYSECNYDIEDFDEIKEIISECPIRINVLKNGVNDNFHYYFKKQLSYPIYEILLACIKYTHAVIKKEIKTDSDFMNFGEIKK